MNKKQKIYLLLFCGQCAIISLKGDVFMDSNNKTIGERIRYYRILRGISQERLSKALGYHSRSAVYNIENGLSGLPTEKVITLAEILGVSPEELLRPASQRSSSSRLRALLHSDDNTSINDEPEKQQESLNKFYTPSVVLKNQCEIHDGILFFDLRNYSVEDRKKIKKVFKSVLSLVAPNPDQPERNEPPLNDKEDI
jgi:transcriptional regulator with XRE-family HTH domain